MAKRIYITESFSATVDDKDYPVLRLFSWRIVPDKEGRPHAVRTLRTNNEAGEETDRARSMERDLAVIGTEGDEGLFKHITHRSGDTLDNRRENLRVGREKPDRIKGQLPAHGYRGISLDQKRAIWCSRIKVAGRFVHGGWFKTAEEAARAYNVLALKHRGEAAVLNVFA